MASHGYDWTNMRGMQTTHSRSPSVEYPPNTGNEGFESDSDDEGVEGSCGVPSSSDLASPGASPGGPTGSTTAGVTLRSPANHPRMDAYRFSLLNLEESLDADLDAILDDLTALGSQFERELKTVESGPGSTGNSSGGGSAGQHTRLTQAPACQTMSGSDGSGHSGTSSGDCGRNYRPHGLDLSHVRQDNHNEGGRTESPDADSAFSDSLSMLSSESSASSGGGSGAGGATTRGLNQASPQRQNSSPTQEDLNRIKAEKIRLALEKIKEANVKKLFIKVFCGDGDSTKSLLVDERMTCAQVSRLLAEKSHLRMEPRLALVERLPHLMMERAFEDHEFLVENLMMWARDSPNTLHFVDRMEKYGVFSCPERYLLGTSSSQKDETMDDEGRASLLEEFFGTGAGVVGGGAAVPEVEGHLYLKAEGKRAWKKHWFVLRASGLYFSPKGRSAKGSSKDLVCLATFEVNQVYYGFGWKKKYRAPTDFTFAIKNPQIQAKAPKHIRYLCAEDNSSLQQWVAGIRIAKWGKQLWDNYRTLMEDITQEDIDILAQERACSVVSVPKQCQQQQQQNHQGFQREDTLSPSTTPTPNKGKEDRHPTTPTAGATAAINREDPIYASRRSSSSSSGCCSSSSTSGSTPTSSAASAATSAEGFECDSFAGPTGTIKRKPSMAPRLPLTATTRLLVKECGMDSVREPNTPSPTEDLSSRHSTHSNAGMPSMVSEAKRNIYGTTGTIRRGSDNRLHHPQPSQVMTAALASMSLRVASGVQERQLQIQAQKQKQQQQSQLQEQKERDQVDCLPLPPPPSELELAAVHQDPDLPPPPPEAYQVPPTPVSVLAANFNHQQHHQQQQIQQQQQQQQQQMQYQQKPDHQQQIYGVVDAGLPPPPTQQQLESIYSTAPQIQKHPVQQPIYQSPPLPKHLQQQPPQVIPPPPPQGILRQSSQSMGGTPPHLNHQNGNLRMVPPSPARKPKKISFSDEAGANNQAVPPREFLKDLRKVMERKWQVAQKVKSGTIRNPYEVLGFRDYEPGTLVKDGEIDSYSHVSRWVLDHYGKPSMAPQPMMLQQQEVHLPQQMQQPIYGTRQPQPPVASAMQQQPIYGTGQTMIRRPQSPSQPPVMRSQSMVQQPPQQQPIYGMHHVATTPESIYNTQRANSYHHGQNDIYGVYQPQQPQQQQHYQVHQQPIYGQTNGVQQQQQQVFYQQPPPQPPPPQQQQQQQIYGVPTATISRITSGPLMRQHSMGVADLNSLHRQQSYSMNDGLRSSQRKKPPPPPKRSDSTQLSAR